MDLKATEDWVWKTLRLGLSERYSYHNLEHTEMVLRDLDKMANHYKLVNYDRGILKTAALFHDIAFVKSHIDHESHSSRIAAKTLPDFGYSPEEVEVVCAMIMATKLPQSPQTFMEGILCDADLFYLGGKHYFELASGLENEWKNIGFLRTERQWLEGQLNFLKHHTYHTDYAINLLAPSKAQIVKQLETQLNELV